MKLVDSAVWTSDPALRSEAYFILAKRLRIVLTTVVTICIVFAAVTFQEAKQYRETTRWVEHEHIVLGSLEELLSTVKDAETGQRGFLLTGRESYLEPFVAANARVYEQLRELQALTTGEPAQRKYVDGFAVPMKEKFAELAETVRLRRESGMEAALKEVLSDRGKNLMTQMRAESASLRAQVEIDLTERERAQAVQGRIVMWSAVGIALTVLHLSLLALWCLRVYRVHQQAWELQLKINNQRLSEQSRRAEAATLAKSNFLAAMSHEIRTPMNAILGMSDMLAESQLNPEQMQYVEVFQRAGANLLVLINDILDLSKIESGHLELESVNFDLEEVVDQSVEIVGVKTRAKGIGLISHLAPGVTTSLVGDPTRLKQVLINLLGNAAKFTDSGELLLKVQNHQSGKPGEIEFSVTDTGIGISPEKLATIFDGFTQADPSITRKYGGTGLGLEISRRLVSFMGGELTATSRVGKGSTFRFNAQFQVGDPTGRRPAAAATDFHGRRILVIDDNATNRFVLGETLSSWGMESAEFGSPVEALSDLSVSLESERPYSLVFVDSEMPEMNGFETASRIKQVAPGLPVVMFTSDVRPGDILRRRAAGLSGYAVKPVKRGELLRLMREALHPNEGWGLPTSGTAKSEDVRPVKPSRILIAEDSADNTLLVRAYLKGSPHHLTFVEDGKAALEVFAAGSFDLIFMDVQMPQMDGLTATRAIRALERERNTAAIPIIALSANAHPHDAELSRLAGCNFHLSKPISKHKLVAAIEEYAPWPTPSAGQEPGRFQPIRIEMPPGLEEIVPGYLAARRKEVPTMMALLSASDFEALAGLSHNIKGTGESYGFPELTRMGAALQLSAKRLDSEALAAQLIDLRQYLGQVQLFAAA